MFRLFVAAALLTPATSFACGMPSRMVARVELNQLMEAVDEAEAPPAPEAQDVAEVPAEVAPPQVETPAPAPEPEPNT